MVLFCWFSRSFSPLAFNGRAKLISWNLKAIEQWQIVNKRLSAFVVTGTHETVIWGRVRSNFRVHRNSLKVHPQENIVQWPLSCNVRREHTPCHMNFLKNSACLLGRTQFNCVSRWFCLPQLLKPPTTAARAGPEFIWYHDIWLMPSELLQLLKAFLRALLSSLCTLASKETGKMNKVNIDEGFRSTICWFLNGFGLQLLKKICGGSLGKEFSRSNFLLIILGVVLRKFAVRKNILGQSNDQMTVIRRAVLSVGWIGWQFLLLHDRTC